MRLRGDLQLESQMNRDRTCLYCGKPFRTFICLIKRGGGLYCSPSCRNKARAGKNAHNWAGKVERNCLECGNSFFIYQSKIDRGKGKFCSRICFENNRRMLEECRCWTCGKVFTRPTNRIKEPERTFCSPKCAGKAHTGSNNHNWNGGPLQRVCKHCGEPFMAIQAEVAKGNGLYCSHDCFLREHIPNTLTKGEAMYSRSHGGKRADLDNRYFRSAWEANWARYLNWLKEQGEILSWEYEPDTFEFGTIKRGSRFYTPDFKITNADGSIEYHEIKGWMDDKSATKLKRMAKYYPDIKVIVIQKDTYRSVYQQIGSMIPNWERNIHKAF